MKSQRVLGIIPARYESSRFPGKPLIDIKGKSMIQRVYEQTQKANGLNSIVVATDDSRILCEVQKFGGNVLITSSNHQSGTDRCQEVVDILKSKGEKFDIVVNIQGDEPYIDPSQIDLVASCYQDPNVKISTLIKLITSEDELFNHHINKVIIDKNKDAIYFSRHTIPFNRRYDKESWLSSFSYFKHIGLYAYRSEILAEITRLKPSPLEQAESLEQLRWIENGFKIRTLITEQESVAIDIPEDLSKISNMS